MHTVVADAPAGTRCAVVELRQYTLKRGQRDALVWLFENFLIEPQEAAGMQVLGQFQDLDDPDRFVWLRGFPDMATRARALQAFYGGPAWATHRDAANGTMIVSSPAARRGLPFFGPYAATKFAQLGLSEALRVELAPQRIAVTSYANVMANASDHYHQGQGVDLGNG